MENDEEWEKGRNEGCESIHEENYTRKKQIRRGSLTAATFTKRVVATFAMSWGAKGNQKRAKRVPKETALWP